MGQGDVSHSPQPRIAALRADVRFGAGEEDGKGNSYVRSTISAEIEQRTVPVPNQLSQADVQS